MPNTDWTIYDEVEREAWQDREPAERPDASECAPSDPRWIATLSPSPVSAADFAPQGDTDAHRASRENDDIPF
jgi:hypothetical protein